jgi:hypothetical protein
MHCCWRRYQAASPYSQPKDWFCVLPARHLPCKSPRFPGKIGVTTLGTLTTIACSADCDFMTHSYSTPEAGMAPASECDVCMDCGKNCQNTPNGPAAGVEIYCFGAALGQACTSCAGVAASPVCGVDGNTYSNACLAQCNNGAGVKSDGSCAGGCWVAAAAVWVACSLHVAVCGSVWSIRACNILYNKLKQTIARAHKGAGARNL